MTAKVFEAAPGIAAPWSVGAVDFDEAAKTLTVRIDFTPGALFTACGHEGAHPVHDTVAKTWRHLNFFQHECRLQVRTPRVKLPSGSVRLVEPDFAGRLARRVVDAVVEHILHRPDDSLGIVTLNTKQRDIVAEMLAERLRALPEAVAFKERRDAEGMGLFIKNLENVQGDERDYIFISTTFGKSKGTDVVRQNFGPISRDGGWRRLNVLFTRSRKSVAVFSSMRPEDIVVDGKTPNGTRALRDYLEFARNGVLSVEKETGLPPDSDFEIAVMDVLRGRCYEVEPQLGVAGFRIDIGVKHPVHKSGYLAAIECDGASYHSAVSVRDRDRIRQEIIESLGWRGRIWRIWSTDWFRNPIAETDSLLGFLDDLKLQPIPAEYLVVEEPASAMLATASGAYMLCQHEAKDLVIDDEDDDLEIEVGDLITYASTEAPEKPFRVRLTARQTNLDQGLLAESTPLGSVLLGAAVGESIVLRVPGKDPQSFVIQEIKRMLKETAQSVNHA